MRRTPLLLLALGVLAFAGFVLAFLPASLLAHFLPPAVQAERLTGTVWNGRAEGVRGGGLALDALSWRCGAVPLLAARLQCDLGIDVGAGRLEAEVTARPDRTMTVNGLRGSVPLEATASAGGPKGWKGQLRFDDVSLKLDAGQPRDLSGLIVAADLRAPQRPGAPLGSFALELGEGFSTPGTTGGRLRDLSGPLALRGTLRIAPEGGYFAEGEVAPKPGAPRDLLDALTFLGPPDASGRRPFTIEGSF